MLLDAVVRSRKKKSESMDNRAGTKGSHVNGWDEIARGLHHAKMRQKDLAEALGVTPSAISQMKSGRIKLNREQIAKICQLLKFDTTATRRFYASIIDARLFWESAEEEYTPTVQTNSGRAK